jgi:hypothetical protein
MNQVGVCTISLVILGSMQACKPVTSGNVSSANTAPYPPSMPVASAEYQEIEAAFRKAHMPVDSSISPSRSLEKPDRGLKDCVMSYADSAELSRSGGFPFYGSDASHNLTTVPPVRAIVTASGNNEWYNCDPTAPETNAWECRNSDSQAVRVYVRQTGSDFFFQYVSKKSGPSHRQSQFDSTLTVTGYMKCRYGSW